MNMIKKGINRIFLLAVTVSILVSVCGIRGIYAKEDVGSGAVTEEECTQSVYGSGTDRAEHKDVSEQEEIMRKILIWQCERYDVENVQELVDEIYTKDALSGVTQSYILGLSGYERIYEGCDLTKYAQALWEMLDEGVRGEREIAPVTYQKAEMVLASLGAVSPVPKNVLYDSIGQKGVMSLCYGLLMLDAESGNDDFNKEELLETLLNEQLPDGGFAVSGESGDVDVTAMVLQALAPYTKEDRNDISQKIKTQIADSTDRAILFLSDKQLPDGDFPSYGNTTAESTAQVLLTLCALDIDVFTEPLFIKEGHTVYDGLMKYKNTDGSFSHTAGGDANDIASSQAFYALAGLWRYEMGESFLFDFQGYERGGYEAIPSKSINCKAIDTREPKNGVDIDYRWIVTGVLFAGCVVYLAVLAVKKKLQMRRVIGCMAVTGILLAAVWMIRIQSREEFLSQSSQKKNGETIHISMEIRCDTVAGEASYIPEDGSILPECEFTMEEGATVFDALKEAARQYDIQIEYTGGSSSGTFAYVEGIGYLYEFDFGDLSGWMYRVNGIFADVGCGEYVLQDGDDVLWSYTVEMGKDIEGYGEN